MSTDKLSKKPRKKALNKGDVSRSYSLTKLANAKRNYDTEVAKMELQLEKIIEFNFFISFQDSDACHVIVNSNTTQNAPLAKCLGIINKKGKLTYKDYCSITI